MCRMHTHSCMFIAYVYTQVHMLVHILEVFAPPRGQIVASLGDALPDRLPECMPILVDRLRNEITRITAVRAISLIARYAETGAPGRGGEDGRGGEACSVD